MLPRTPPVTVRSVLSTRNCAATSLRRAPRARRTPTSRVRSATLASMMFMIPMPPTSRLMAATAPVTTLKTRCVRSRWRRISRGTITSSGSPPVARRTTAWAMPAAVVTASGDVDAEHDLVDAVGARVGAPVEGLEGDEHRAVEVPPADGGAPAAQRRPSLEDAHHLVPVAAEAHRLAERAPQGEERPRHGGPQHRHPLAVDDVERGEEAPGGELEPRRVAVGGRRAQHDHAGACGPPPPPESSASRSGATERRPGTTPAQRVDGAPRAAPAASSRRARGDAGAG